LDNDDDIFSNAFKSNGRTAGDDYVGGTDSEDDLPQARKRGRQTRTLIDPDQYTKEDEDIDMKDIQSSDDDAVLVDEKTAKSNKTAAPTKTTKKAAPAPPKVTPKKPAASKKRKTPEAELDTDEFVSENEPPKKAAKGKKATATAKSPAKKKAKKDDVVEDARIQEIFDSIPKVDAPKPPPRDPNKKFNYAAHAANQANASATSGTIEKPVGAENCLAGLSFVFTGVLSTLGRDEGQALVKQYGGKVMGAASKKTSFVVLGSDAGPKKLEVIRDNNLRTINEDGLFELIRRLPANGGDGKAAADYEEKQKKEKAKIAEAAAEVEKEEKAAAKAAAAKIAAGGKALSTAPPATGPDNRLWTVKYAPTQLNQICGNKSLVEKLQNWLRMFPKNKKHKFKMAGKDGSGVYRAVMIHGPPGIGKTTAAHLVAKIEGYDIVESNASDTRSKKLVEEGLRGVLSTTSLMGYFSADSKNVDASKKKLVLIMDEVDGMSAGDRGGVGALAAVCKKSEIPMILICNDRKLPKMKPFDFCTFDMPFRRPTTDMIRARIMTIAFREQLKLPPPVINALIEGTHADIRQVVNMLSTAKLDQKDMDFDESKAMSKAWEKHVILKPWDITNKILGGGLFAQSSKATLNDKIELYFNDHEFSPLMLQENYLGTSPMLAGSLAGREKNMKSLELAEQAASSISDGDLVDRMIHGSQQQWSLMPTHAVLGFVRPASFVSGTQVGHQTRFTTWLGQNSKQGLSKCYTI
jgi:replication factor C subunit 1